MKKILSLSLMAVALLISGQAKAVNVAQVGTEQFSSVYAAINYINEKNMSEATIDMLESSTETEILYFDGGKTFTWNFNGKTVTIDGKQGTDAAWKANVHLENATLNLNGEGTLQFKPSYGAGHGNNHYMIQVHGSNDENATTYSVLNVDKGMNLLAGTVTDYPKGDSWEAYAIDVIERHTKYGAKTEPTSDQDKAFGVVVNLEDCYIQGCLAIIGNISAIGPNAPKFNISENAAVTLSQGDQAIYAAGYGFWNIKGTIQGPTGVYVKSGSVTLDGATIIATGTYSEPQANSNGTTGGGSGIILDTSYKEYAGNMELIVNNNTSVTSQNGYAVEELITVNASTVTSQVTKVEINGGNFEGSDQAGCLKTTDEVKNKIVETGSLTGGIFNEDIIDYVNNANKVITYVDTDEGEQKWTIGNIPSGQTWQNDFNTPNSYVQLNNTDPDAQQVTEVTGEKTIEYLAVLGNDKVVVKAGARLNVGEVVLNEDAVLVIEPLAMVVVTTKQGIISTSNDQLIIEASAGEYGQLLINPSVSFNTTPHATIEFTTVSYKNSDADYFYERFALPTGFIVDSIKSDAYTYFEKWNPNKNEWTSIGYLNPQKQGQTALDETQMNTPFANYRMFTPVAGVKYKFFGKLQGTKDVNLTVKGHSWVGLGNSYAANMDVKTVLEALREVFQGDAKNLSLSYQKCIDPVNHLYQWSTVTLDEDDLEDKSIIRPMEVFLIKNDGPTVTLPISYENMIWNLINK